MESTILYLIPALGILGLVVMAFNLHGSASKLTGEENMVELATYIAERRDGVFKSGVENFSLFCSRCGNSSRRGPEHWLKLLLR